MYSESKYGRRTLPATAPPSPRGAVVARSRTRHHRVRRWRGGVEPDRSPADGGWHDPAGQSADARAALVPSRSRAGGDDSHGSVALGPEDAERTGAGTTAAGVDR